MHFALLGKWIKYIH